MPDENPDIVQKVERPLPYLEQPVRCRECEHLFKSYVYRVLTTPREDTLLVDADGDIIYDLAKVCPKCKKVYHWHTNDKTLIAHSTAFERLMRHYQAPSAIINSDNSTG